jgi:heptosyltransferase III
MEKLNPNPYQRILIIATRQIGDVLCTTPLMRRARELWPGAVIDVLGYTKTMGMLVGNSDINEVIESSEHPKWPEYKRLIKRIFRKYDLAIVTQASDRAHIYGLLAASRRIGVVPSSNQHAWWKKWTSAFHIQMAGADRHVIVDRMRLIDGYARKIGLTPKEGEIHQPVLRPPQAEPLPRDIQTFLVKPYLVIHSTPMWRYKQWPTVRWAQLIDALVKEGHQVVLTGSGGTSDRTLNGLIYSHLSESIRTAVLDVSGRLTLGQVTALLRGAQAYVGVDTSITHQAAAVGVPVVGLFGPTSPVYFGPWPREAPWVPSQDSVWQRTAQHSQQIGNVTIVQGVGTCVPCMRAGCEDHNHSHSLCLDQLDHETVLQALKGAL